MLRYRTFEFVVCTHLHSFAHVSALLLGALPRLNLTKERGTRPYWRDRFGAQHSARAPRNGVRGSRPLSLPPFDAINGPPLLRLAQDNHRGRRRRERPPRRSDGARASSPRAMPTGKGLPLKKRNGFARWRRGAMRAARSNSESSGASVHSVRSVSRGRRFCARGATRDAGSAPPPSSLGGVLFGVACVALRWRCWRFWRGAE